MNTEKPALLVLQDGRCFRGYSLGAAGETSGEVCFNTGSTGYQEILTDPSYCRQIVTFTTPHIGNYGFNRSDVESHRVQAAGLVVKEATAIPSGRCAPEALPEYLKSRQVVGIMGVDTRALTLHIREGGVLNGIISTRDFNPDSLRRKLSRIPPMEGQDLTRRVSCRRPYEHPRPETVRYRVALIDCGVKTSILRRLAEAGCRVSVYPVRTAVEAIMDRRPDGIVISNGPGDPAAVTGLIPACRRLIGSVPLLGICLGHQILALALEARTYKLKFGHRGANHPVRNLLTGRVEITSQNHGFAVDADSLPKDLQITHLNLNDGTLEGFRWPDRRILAVQFHPEAGPGPHDARPVFTEFTAMMEARR